MVDLIAEIGCNHVGDMKLLEEMIVAAREAGATHAKMQVWKESHLKPGPWDNDGRRSLYRNAELTARKLLAAKALCDHVGVRFLVSIFDERDVESVAEISSDEVKIPSPEIANTSLLNAIARNFEKVYLSTGASTESEIDNALEVLLSSGKQVVLMHCVSVYPCSDALVNLPRIRHLQQKHPAVGLSDHTPDILSSLFAIATEVVAIEKHFTTDKSLPGRDNQFSILPSEFAEISKAVMRYELMSHDRGVCYVPGEEPVRTVYRGRWGA